MPEHQQIQQSKKMNTIFQKQATPIIQTPVSNPYSIIQRAKVNPRSLTRADIMQLHRTIGNQAVGRLLTGIGNTSTAHEAPIQCSEIPEEEEKPMQGKFETVQRLEIPEEEEPLQGKMADTIQRQKIPEKEEPLQGKMIGTIQRQEIPEEEEPWQGKMAETIQCQEIPEEEEPLQDKMIGTVQRQEIPEEEEPLQGKMVEPIQLQEIPEEEEPLQGKMIETVQRQEIPEEEEPLQGKMIETVQRQALPEEEEPLQGKMIGTIQRQEITEEEPLQAKAENNTGMPDNLKAGVESLSGIDMSDVKVHYNSDKPAEVRALAYTQGTNIHVAPGQERNLPHEAWHVVQQAQGRVRPTMQMKGCVPVNDDARLECEADVMGLRAVKTKAPHTRLDATAMTSGQLVRNQGEVAGKDTSNFLSPLENRCQHSLSNSSRDHINSRSHPFTEKSKGVTLVAPVQLKTVVQLASDPATKQIALERHQANQERVYSIINAALNTRLDSKIKPTHDKLMKNSAELINQNFVHLYVLSRTDAVPSLRQNGEVSYFDKTVRYPNLGGTYNDVPDNHTHELAEEVNGHADHHGEIRFYDPSDLADEEIRSIVIHEMQHQADYHRPEEDFTETGIDEHATALVMNAYKTEFRAYWIGGLLRKHGTGVVTDRLGYAFLSATNSRKVDSGSVFTRNYTTAFSNQRQSNIFWHMVDSGSYPYVLRAYQNSPAFRDMVHAYTMPVGGNLLNSPRIEALRNCIKQIYMLVSMRDNQEANSGGFSQRKLAVRLLDFNRRISTQVSRLAVLRGELDQEDIEFLTDIAVSEPFWNFVTDKIGDAARQELKMFLLRKRSEIMLSELSQPFFNQ